MAQDDYTTLYWGIGIAAGLTLLGTVIALASSNTTAPVDNTQPDNSSTSPAPTPLAFMEYYPYNDAADFQQAVINVASAIGVDPNWLMFIMYNESAGTFRPDIKNGQYTGLIQIGNEEAAALGTTTAALAAMTAVQQMQYVQAYFNYWHNLGSLTNVYDTYLVVFYPAAVNKANSFTFPGYVTAANPEFFKGRGNTKQDFIDAINTIVPNKYKSVVLPAAA